MNLCQQLSVHFLRFWRSLRSLSGETCQSLWSGGPPSIRPGRDTRFLTNKPVDLSGIRASVGPPGSSSRHYRVWAQGILRQAHVGRAAHPWAAVLQHRISAVPTCSFWTLACKCPPPTHPLGGASLPVKKPLPIAGNIPVYSSSSSNVIPGLTRT